MSVSGLAPDFLKMFDALDDWLNHLSVWWSNFLG